MEERKLRRRMRGLRRQLPALTPHVEEAHVLFVINGGTAPKVTVPSNAQALRGKIRLESITRSTFPPYRFPHLRDKGRDIQSVFA